MARRNFTDSDLGLLRHFDPQSLDYLISDYLVGAKVEAKRDAVLASRVGVLTQTGDESAAKAVVKAKGKRPDVYRYRHPWEGDQGNTPRCTGFAGVKAWLAGPTTRSNEEIRAATVRAGQPLEYVKSLDISACLYLLADALYQLAVQIDRTRHGLHFDGGATMLALAKAGQQLGLWDAYYWGYTLSDVYAAHDAGFTPILGIWWRSAMDNPVTDKAIITYEGRFRGGHAILNDGLDIDPWGDFARKDNTWGRKTYGANGYVRMPVGGGNGLEGAMADDGEVLLVVETKARKAA